MSSAMLAVVVSTDVNMRAATPLPTAEEILRAAQIYWPEVSEKTLMMATECEAVEIPTVTQEFEWLIERIELRELLVFADGRTQKMMMGYGPQSNVLAVWL